MSSIKYLSVMSASMLIWVQSASALEIGDGGLPWLTNNISDTHHTHPLELKPIPSSGYKLAKSQFLPDVVESDNSFNDYRELDKDYNKGNCKDKSSLFTTKSCSYPRAVLANSKCTFVPGYYKDCVCQPQFTITSCPAPKYKSSPQCDGKAERCLCPPSVILNNPNDKCTQICDGKCTAKTCTPTPDESGCKYGTKSVSDNCGGTRQVCLACNLTPCSGLSDKPANSFYTTSSCTDCSGTKTINSGWECNSGFHKSGSICAANCSLPNCSNSVSSKPANSYYLTSSCTDCSGTKTINTGWSCIAGYTQNGSNCIMAAKVGDILYSDMTTNSDIVSGKTPIGIVFDGIRRRAIALTEEQKVWATRNFLIKTIPYYVWGSDNEAAMEDRDGLENTPLIVNYCQSQSASCPAAEYTYSYSTPGTSAGDWYFPAMGEMNDIYNQKAVLNQSLNKINGQMLSEKNYFSSSQGSYTQAWYKNLGNGYKDWGGRTSNSLSVRPAIKY